MRRSITTQSAEVLALKALAFLMNSESARDRFLAESGADLLILRERAGDPQFLAAVMDFLLADDALAGEFCGIESLDPQTLHAVRHALPGAT